MSHICLSETFHGPQELTALPQQSTAEDERTYSRLNNNTNKLRNRLAVCTLEAIIRSSENFPHDFDFEGNKRLMHLYGKARKTYFEKL